MLSRLTHQALRLACWQGDRRFAGQRDVIERVQRDKLAQLLRDIPQEGRPAITSWEAFRERVPLSRYSDWRDRIDGQRSGGPMLSRSQLVRYQPTSGSSERLKLIPYTRRFLGELDAAIAPWVASLYRQHPGLRSGVHYWSVSWLPESQRHLLDGNFNDDSELLGGVKRMLAAWSQAVPAGVAFAGAAADAMFATLAFLLARDDLRMLSVWSPTFMLQMLEAVEAHGEELAEVLESGYWGRRAASLRNLEAPSAPRRAALLRAALAAPPRGARPAPVAGAGPGVGLGYRRCRALGRPAAPAFSPGRLRGQGSLGHRGRRHHSLCGALSAGLPEPRLRVRAPLRWRGAGALGAEGGRRGQPGDHRGQRPPALSPR